MDASHSLRGHQFWPTALFTRTWEDHAREAPAIIERLYALKDQQAANIQSDVAPRAKADDGLFEGELNLLDDPHPGLAKLKAFLAQTVAQVVHVMTGKKVEPRRLAVRISDSWYHITNDGGFHDVHTHSQCSWCGIYYVRAGETGRGGKGAPNGGNRFYSPFMAGGRFQDFGSTYMDNAYVDPPAQDGMVIIFPAYLQHSALPYRGEEDRIVIAFNSQTMLRPE